MKWKSEKRKIADLIPAEYNPRKISDKQTVDLENSLERFDVAAPIIINADNKVIGGHQRLKILQARGINDVDVRVPNRQLTEKEAKELNLRLNKNTGDFDLEMLAMFPADILKEVGFTSDELQSVFDIETKEDGFDAESEYAKIEAPKTKRGDIYVLGRHRVLCGDSTSQDDVMRVMGGALADMVFTDPPYNVNYSYAKYEDIGRNRKKKFKDNGKIFNDKKTPDEFYNFLCSVFKNVYAVSKSSMTFYVCHATKTQDQFFDAYRDAGFHFSQTIIWVKERIVLALGQDYHRCYEPIIYGWKKGEKRYVNKKMTKEKEVWDLDRLDFEERMDVWFISRDKSSDYVHPTQKPVRLPERAIKKNCPMEGILFELFGGSGSTMMACEQLGRSCYSIEMDPKYCDVIIKRWEKFTGKKAVLNAGA